MARPVRRFAPRLPFDPERDAPPPESVAHWGEHMIVEDVATALHRDGTMSSFYHLVTQLHGDQQLAAWDEVIRSFDVRRERQRIATARLWFPDSGWIKAAQKTHTVSAPGPVANTYGRTIVARFHPLRPGVILEYEEYYDSFKVDDSGPMFANNFFLRTGPPCRRRRYTTAVAKPFRLIHHTHHWPHAPVERHDGDYHVCTWEVEDAEGMEFDEWTPPVRDFGPWVDVTTAEGWAPFARQLRNELETWKEVGHDVAAVARDLARDKTTPIEKASAAYAYVAGSVRYGRPPVEMEGRNSRTAEQIMKDLRGDCKDKSALLVQLLRSMNLTAHVAAVLTADSGRTPFLPSCRFNHALVRLEHEGAAYWLDAAGGPFAFGELPAIDQNIFALVLDRNAYRFELIRPRERPAFDESHECRGALTRDGAYEFAVSKEFSGETAARLRMQLEDRTEKRRLHLLQSWLGNDYSGAAGSEFTHGAVDDLARNFHYQCRARIDRAARRIQDLYVFRVPWSGQLSMSGPLAAAERNQPLVVPLSFQTLERHWIDLPEGVAPFALPDPVSCECPWGAYSRRIVAEGRRLACERRLRLTGDSFVPSERFAEIRDFWQQCSWADGAEVVLRCE
jgi:hypothetical protein